MQPLTLDQLAALCDEIAALARAGVPLDRGLREVATEIPGRVSRVAAELGAQIASGEQLTTLLRNRPGLFPPAYQAILEVGVRVGSLPAALETISHSARIMADMRQSVRLAWIYPYCILATAYGSTYVLMQTMPVLWDFLVVLELPLLGWEQALAWLFQRQNYWFPWIGIGLLLGMVGHGSVRSAQQELFGSSSGISRWGSGWKGAQFASQQAAFCELLAAMLEHGLQLPLALRLAAEGSSATGTAGKLTETCTRLDKGDTTALADAPLPPLVKCVVQSAGSATILAQQLRKLSSYYRRRADARVAWAGMSFQFILAFAIGIPLLAALLGMFFWPWLRLLQRLVEPTFT